MRFLDLAVAGTFAAIVVGVALFATMVEHRGPSADASVSLSALVPTTEDPAYEADPSLVRFAVAAVLSPTVLLDEYEALGRYLADRLGRPVEMVRGQDYAQVNALVRSGDVTVALVCSGPFVLGRRDFGMEALAVPVVDGATTYHSYLITGAGSGIESWEDIRGKTFAFTDPLSNSGRLSPVYTLGEMGESPEAYFESSIFTYSHDKSVQAVARGLVDAAAVDSLVYDAMVRRDPAVAAATRVIWKSPAYGINPIVVHPDADADLKRDLQAALLGMSAGPAGRSVLERLEIEAFALPTPGMYDSIERMVERTAGW